MASGSQGNVPISDGKFLIFLSTVFFFFYLNEIHLKFCRLTFQMKSLDENY